MLFIYVFVILYLERSSMEKNNYKSVDFILLLLYSPGYTGEVNEPIAGRTKITKMLFLFEKELATKFHLSELVGSAEIDKIFNFEGWNYGPMSKTLFKDIDFLKNINFVEDVTNLEEEELSLEEIEEYNSYIEDEKSENSLVTEYKSEVLKLTPKGIKFIEDKNKYDALTDEQKQLLINFKAKFNKAKLYHILKYVYTNPKYIQYLDKSKIRNKFLGD